MPRIFCTIFLPFPLRRPYWPRRPLLATRPFRQFGVFLLRLSPCDPRSRPRSREIPSSRSHFGRQGRCRGDIRGQISEEHFRSSFVFRQKRILCEEAIKDDGIVTATERVFAESESCIFEVVSLFFFLSTVCFQFLSRYLFTHHSSSSSYELSFQFRWARADSGSFVSADV